MGGTEREFMGTLEMLPPRDRDHHYQMENDNSMRDFWRSTSDRESHQERRESGGRGGQTIGDMHRLEEHSHHHGPYGYQHQQQLDPPNMEVAARSSLGSSHDAFYTDYHPGYHHHHLDSATSSALISAQATYTNFFNTCVDHHQEGNHHHEAGEQQQQHHHLKHEPGAATLDVPRYMTSDPQSHYNNNGSSLAPVAIPMSHHDVTFSTTMASESITRDHDMESLRRELAYKCPRSSDLLMSITSAADAAVREHGSATSGVGSSDDDDAADHELEQKFYPSSSEHDQDMRAAIVEHPYYPEMVVAHIRLFKIGAPKALRNKLDDITKKFQRFQENSTMNIGDDPSLDFFMRSYVDLLAKLGEDLEEPFNKFMQFKDATTKALENICGHYIETGPDESDNYGYDIGPADGAHDSDDQDTQGDEGLMYNSYGDIDESIVVDPTAPEEELRKMLMLKYGRHIGGLKAEFNRVRKKGKLPANARSILKDWFNRHSYWPYPSEVEKQYLQRICSLNLKQINNWFINERKRHWSCEGKCMHPNAKFYNNGEGKGHQE